MVARGPGWVLCEGETGYLHVRILPRVEDPATTWNDLRRALAELMRDHGRRSVLLDLARAPRLGGWANRTAEFLLRDLEAREIRVAILIGPDAVQRVRVHRALAMFAPECGRTVSDMDRAQRWLTPALDRQTA